MEPIPNESTPSNPKPILKIIPKRNSVIKQFQMTKDTLITDYLIFRKTPQVKKYSEITFELNKLNLPTPSPSSLIDPMPSFQKKPIERTFNDIHIIKWYLYTSPQFKKFRNDFSIQQSLPNNNHSTIQDNNNLARLCIICATEMNYLSTQPKEFLFKMGAEADTFYLILNGSVDLLKTRHNIKRMTGYQYFRFLIDLKLKGEHYQDEILELNYATFPVQPDDYPNLHYIVFLNFFKEIMMGMAEGKTTLKYTIEEIASHCLIDLNVIPMLDLPSLEITKDYLSAYHLIVDYLPKFCYRKLSQYAFLHEDYDIKNVITFEYYSFLTFNPGDFFGDSGIDTKQKRNATVQSVGVTEYAILHRDTYSHSLGKERQIVIKREANFLHKSFFFEPCPLRLFEWRYFNKFINLTKLKGEILCEEGKECDYVYFIRKGDFELYSYKNIIEMHKTCKEIKEKIKEIKEIKKKNNELKGEGNSNGNGNDDDEESETNDDTYDGKHYYPMENNLNDLKKILKQRYKKKIFLYGDHEIIGLESFYFEMNYMTTAVVLSEEAKVYRIDKKNFNEVINSERSIKEEAYNVAMNKMTILYERLFMMNKTNIGINDKKESYYRKNSDIIDNDNQKKTDSKSKSKIKVKEYIDRNGDHDMSRNKMKRSTSAVSRCDYINKSFVGDFLSKREIINSNSNIILQVKPKQKVECILPEIISNKHKQEHPFQIKKPLNPFVSSVSEQPSIPKIIANDKQFRSLMKEIQSDKIQFPILIGSKSTGDINNSHKNNKKERIEVLLQEQEQEKLRLWAEVTQLTTLGYYPISINPQVKKTIVFNSKDKTSKQGGYMNKDNNGYNGKNQGCQVDNKSYAYSSLKTKKIGNVFNKRTIDYN